jgi:hypothetical protein
MNKRSEKEFSEHAAEKAGTGRSSWLLLWFYFMSLKKLGNT